MGSKALTKIKIHPTGMRLHEWICLEEGFFEQQGLDVEVLWGVVHNKMRAWQDGEQGYKKRPRTSRFSTRSRSSPTPAPGAASAMRARAWGNLCRTLSAFPDTRSLSGRSLRS